MNFAQLNLIPAIPEISLVCLLGIVLLTDLFLTDQRRWITYALTVFGLVGIIFIQYYVIGLDANNKLAFSGMFRNDGLASIAKFTIYGAGILVLVYSRCYLETHQIYKGEFYTLTLFALLGMDIMVSANNFLLLYIGLELLSLSLYALIALRRDDGRASEAALKYFVLGSLASGILLYGISLIYGGTGGNLQLNTIINIISYNQANNVLIDLGLIFIVVGIAFKLGTVPFHMWVPDVYQGSPTAVTALIGSAPKIAATVFAFRILVGALGLNFNEWATLLEIIAIASLFIGNIVAIMQTNIKRMLAYSTISHMGFVVLAFVGNALLGVDHSSVSFSGLASAIYYSITYVLMSLVAFGVLIALSTKDVECENISDLAGLNHRYPWLAFLMLLAMFSMAGIPPLMGFYAKFSVIVSLAQQHHIVLAVYAVIMSLIGAFYYLRVVKTMYFDEPAYNYTINFGIAGRILLSLNGLALLIFGIFPSTILKFCMALFQIN